MSEERWFRLIAWVTARHLTHYQAVLKAGSRFGASLMRLVSPEMYYHAEVTLSQAQELGELRVLSAAFDLKSQVRQEGKGWKNRHGEPLDSIADALVNGHDWESEDVGRFVDDLTEGVFVYSGADDDDDDED